jgi:hypothetical protein
VPFLFQLLIGEETNEFFPLKEENLSKKDQERLDWFYATYYPLIPIERLYQP